MAGQRGAIPAAWDNREQQEAEEITVLSPRTSTVHLLAVEDSLGDLHDKFDKMMDSLETLNQRMDGLLAPARIEANVVNDRNDGNKGGRQARRNHRNLPNQKNDRIRRPNEVPLGDEQGNIWNDNGDFQMRQAYRGQEARREVHHDYKMKIDLPVHNGKRDITSFLDWIKSTENFFNYMDTPHRKKGAFGGSEVARRSFDVVAPIGN
ncbi:reverse transcriptase [Cucumis melo var. makuwa]|uniref:Reverse transcriptase n=2 Tax=Cucumis melo TaxID=3656 RepID=A0A5D3DKV9_CUCMM|nr:reverse transcriptase [Cucumis melo var. makuwa]TYK24263.1 reverse transcriptase [Cucumis melo var. makuwa]